MSYCRRGVLTWDRSRTVQAITDRLEKERAKPSLQKMWDQTIAYAVGQTVHTFGSPFTVESIHPETGNGLPLDPPLKCGPGDWIAVDMLEGRITVHGNDHPIVIYERDGDVFRPADIPYSQ